ncbi:MAG: maltose alpha-D-glucosyltransferase, partial [Xanthomonas perforans]|nr:maltose alpha-D-glucosyltransferase [Xanthomonas perforans]
ELGVAPVQLVHGLQNHDELTYELVHWATRHAEDEYHFRGEEITGGELAELVRAELTEKLVDAGDYNRVFTQNGIACTSTSLIAATRGIPTLDDITDADVPAIRDAHLLLCAYNAWQPGVFGLSGWDLVGMLTLPGDEVADLIRVGDTRWIERGAHDLLDVDPSATRSTSGMPRGRALYGPLPAQLEDPDSFASRLSRIIELRREHGIATATQVDIPEVAHAGMLVLVHRLDDGHADEDAPVQVTVLNFSAEATEGTVRSEHLVPQSDVVDAASGETIGRVDDLQSFSVSLDGYGAKFLLLRPQTEE